MVDHHHLHRPLLARVVLRFPSAAAQAEDL
jgi:hypothetical protein